ncbi:DUF1654 domain-containing protein [Pseudomonas putida]|uniref:DUF1654 domain-containing protein n=1 Tax=Pseudomonas putida TaxID=303 RepID=UPI00105A51F7|nr:DUF1654 domain-containing protein [Pseudomonas putida]TDJ74659.1 DUF1654 domain-containing protein [Pseudomonas putida]
MSAQKRAGRVDELTSLELLGLRVSAMINSPVAQLDRKVMVHRMDTDRDQDWDAIMALLAETGGLEMVFYDDGSVLLKWDTATDDDRVIDRVEDVAVIDSQVQAPF